MRLRVLRERRDSSAAAGAPSSRQPGGHQPPHLPDGSLSRSTDYGPPPANLAHGEENPSRALCARSPRPPRCAGAGTHGLAGLCPASPGRGNAATRRLLDWPLAPRRGARGRPLAPPLGPIGGFVTSSHAGVRPRPATAPGTPPPRPAVPAPPYVSRGPLKRGDCDLDLGALGHAPVAVSRPIASGPCGPSHRTRAVARAGHRLSS